MQNFFNKKQNNTSSENPFKKVNFAAEKNIVTSSNVKTGKRLNIIDMDVLNVSSKNTEIEFLEIKMNNLYQIINQNPQNLDPIALEKMKMEWEELRDRVYQNKNKQKKKVYSSKKSANIFSSINKSVKVLITLFKFNNPKIRQIIKNFNEINKDVEDLVKRSTPLGEEEIKYGMLVNKIHQATKLNDTLSNEIK